MNKQQITELARELRRNQTPAEKLLWARLRNRKLKGHKFHRQHPILYESFNYNNKYFIPDFYCAEKRLIIELDGGIHDFQQEYDKNREAIINDLGLKLIRFKNEEIEDIDRVLDVITQFIDSP